MYNKEYPLSHTEGRFKKKKRREILLETVTSSLKKMKQNVRLETDYGGVGLCFNREAGEAPNPEANLSVQRWLHSTADCELGKPSPLFLKVSLSTHKSRKKSQKHMELCIRDSDQQRIRAQATDRCELSKS